MIFFKKKSGFLGDQTKTKQPHVPFFTIKTLPEHKLKEPSFSFSLNAGEANHILCIAISSDASEELGKVGQDLNACHL